MAESIARHFAVTSGFHIEWTPIASRIQVLKTPVHLLWCYLLSVLILNGISRMRGTFSPVILRVVLAATALCTVGCVGILFVTCSRPAKLTIHRSEPVDAQGQSTPGKPESAHATSPFVGMKVRLKNPAVYLGNLPKGERFNTYSVLVADNVLDQFSNPCGNCVDSRRMEKPISVTYVPEGTELTVIDSFSTSRTGIGYGSRSELTYVVLKDDQGRTSEISDLGFQLHVLAGRVNHLDDKDEIVLEGLKRIPKNGSASINFCFSNPIPGLGGHRPESPEKRLQAFANDFKLEDKLSYRQARNIDPKEYVGCYRVDFHSQEPLMAAHYFFRDWDIWGRWFPAE